MNKLIQKPGAFIARNGRRIQIVGRAGNDTSRWQDAQGNTWDDLGKVVLGHVSDFDLIEADEEGVPTWERVADCALATIIGLCLAGAAVIGFSS